MGADELLLIWAMVVAPGILPTLGRSTRMLCVLAAIGAIIPLYWWATAFGESDSKSRALAELIALHPTVSWVLGMIIAVLQTIGIARGWSWARFPIPTLTALTVIGALTLLVMARYFAWS